MILSILTDSEPCKRYKENEWLNLLPKKQNILRQNQQRNHGNSSSTASDDPSILSFTEHVSSVQQKTQYRPPASRMRENCRSSAKSVSPIDGNLASSRAKDQIEAETTARHSSRSIIPM